MRKLVWMADFRERVEWNRAASLIQKINNVHAGKQSELIKDFRDVHPHFIVRKLAKVQRGPTPDQIDQIKQFIGSM